MKYKKKLLSQRKIRLRIEAFNRIANALIGFDDETRSIAIKAAAALYVKNSP